MENIKFVVTHGVVLDWQDGLLEPGPPEPLTRIHQETSNTVYYMFDGGLELFSPI